MQEGHADEECQEAQARAHEAEAHQGERLGLPALYVFLAQRVYHVPVGFQEKSRAVDPQADGKVPGFGYFPS